MPRTGAWIAFRDGTGRLGKVATDGGSPITILEGGEDELNPRVFGRSLQWADDGTIVFMGADGPGRVSEVGGSVERLKDLGGPPVPLPRRRGSSRRRPMVPSSPGTQRPTRSEPS